MSRVRNFNLKQIDFFIFLNTQFVILSGRWQFENYALYKHY